MGLDAMRIRVLIRRFLVVSIRTSYKSVRKHPFLVGMVFFLIFLYRSFPLLFSLLVSSSPVFVCTAILLGTLLSFGEPNIPEIEKETEEVSHEISSFKAGAIGDATVVLEKDEDFFVENFAGKKKDAADEATGKDNWEQNRVSKIEGDDGLGDYKPLIDVSSRDIKFEKQVNEEVEREFNDLEQEKNGEIYKEQRGIGEVLSNEEAVENHFSLVQDVGDESVLVEEDKSPAEFIEAEKGDHLNFELPSWKRINDDDEEEEEEEEEDDEASDSGSDGAESSSPDASLADIIPMLDELHPLLDEETPQPAGMSQDGSDAGSECSHKFKEGRVVSEYVVKNQEDGEEEEGEEEEDGDDDNDNEEREEAQGDKEDESKCAIKWTEDDQKNLMDLGTSELERNQRLESLIARRRARRNMRLMAEKNLIDLDGADLPLAIPPISTARHNPFDLPYDSYDNAPGSAPSVLLPRHNPFDLPYDSNEEKPDLKVDSFQQEFSAFQQRELVFRRHESFSVGPSIFGPPKQERQGLRWKPYFVPERFGTDETSYQTFQRQLSEVSESKLSSVPDTESVSSALEEEDKKLYEEDISQETEMLSNLDCISLLVEHGSLSSEGVDSIDIENIGRKDVQHGGDEIILGDVQNHHELDSSLSTPREETPAKPNRSEILLQMEPVEEECSSRSSLSSASEVDKKLPDVKKRSTSPDPGDTQIAESHISTSLDSVFHFMDVVVDENQERQPVLEPRGYHLGERVSVMQTSFDSDFHFTNGVEDDNKHMEPVFEPTRDHTGDSGILVQASLDSDSHFKTVVVDNDQQQELVLEPSGSESCILTQTSLNSDFHFVSGVVDDIQHQEPVYDSSPQGVGKFSFLSVSSDTRATSEMGSPSALAEFSGKESEVHTRNMGKNTCGNKETYEGSSKEHSLDENESRSREVTEVEHDANVGLSEDDLAFDFQKDKNGFVKSESVVEHDVADLPPSSSNNGSVKEDHEYGEESSNNESEELHSSIANAEIVIGHHQDVIDKLDSVSSGNHMASEKPILNALEEHPPVAADVSMDSKLSPSGSESVKEHAMYMEDILQPEQEEVPSSGLELMSSNELNLSENEERQPAVVAEQVLEAHPDASSSEIKLVEEHSSSADAMIVDSLLQDADVKLVSSGSSCHVPAEAKSHFEVEKQLSWSDKSIVVDDDKSQEPSVMLVESRGEVNIVNNINVPEVFDHEISETALFSPESLEYKSKVDEFDFKDNILDKIVYEDSGHVLEHPNYSETHRSSVAEENINEDEDEIKEIDEGLLSELDTVGDFSVKEVVGESLHDEKIPGKTSIAIPEYNLLPGDSSAREIKPELPILEVRSVTDMELAFKQLHEGVDVEEVIIPSMIEDQPFVASNLQVVEARSLEDLNVALKQASEGNNEETSKLSDSMGGPASVNEVGSSSSAKELPVLEVRTINDIDLAFKQLDEGVEVEEVILPSMIEDQPFVASNLQVVEARSLEDLNIAMQRASEGNNKEMPKLSDSMGGPASVNEVGSSSSAKELPTLEVRTINDIDLAFKQLNEGVDVEEVILPSTIEQHLANNESGNPQHSSFDLQVIEARSLDDLHVAMKQVSEANTEDKSKPSDLNEGPAEVNEVGSSISTKELPVLEVRTTDDIDRAFNQPNNGADFPCIIGQNLVVNQSSDPLYLSPDLQDIEASSVEDLDSAMKEVSGVKIEQLPKSSDSIKDISRTSEVNEIDATKGIESSTVEAHEAGVIQESGSSTVEFGSQQMSTAVPGEPKQ